MALRPLPALALALACFLPALAQAQMPPRDDLAGKLRMTTLDNALVADVARQNDVSTLEVLAANFGLDRFHPVTQESVLLPTAHVLPEGPRAGILINLAEYRLYYFMEARLVLSAPIGIGQEGNETPLGQTTVLRKQKAPTWVPTPGTHADVPDLPPFIPPGPENPLGDYALYLGWPTYLIHGTNDPYGIGRRFSRGCIRLYPEDIETLFNMVPIGTQVTVVNEPVKLGWHEGELFLEAHPDFAQLEELRLKLSFTQRKAENLSSEIIAAAGERERDLDWVAVRSALERRSGVPVQITSTKTHPVDIVERGAGF
jgi:L,D-transpeptidase ErfK/SrfK